MSEVKNRAESDITGMRVEILVAESHSGCKTFDGIDCGAERVAEEVSNQLSSFAVIECRLTLFYRFEGVRKMRGYT